MAYASVASLMRKIELLLTFNSPGRSLIRDNIAELIALHGKISSLRVFLKNFEKSNDSGEMTDLEAQIKEVAEAVEHTIQMTLTEAVVANDEMQKEKAHERFCDSLKQVAEDIDRVQKETKKIQDKGKQASKESLVLDSSTKDIPNLKNNMVGRDDERKRLLENLTRGFSGEPKVIPIVGMGGIGKTTLAKEVFSDASIRSHFDVRAWATISSQYNVKDIYVSLLLFTKETKDERVHMKDEAELADMLQKSLKGKRYLIVMDDMWNSKAWDDVRQCFPSEDKGSRILLTTRNTEVACYAGTGNLSLQMDFMNPDESWKLFKCTGFADVSLPHEFETIGKHIVDKCQGLPLSIIVVAGLLSKSKRTLEDWKIVARDVRSFVTDDPDKQCLHVLGLSYNHLTSDLKACLLYFGIFPEDSEIPVKKLVSLWMAEGFLKLENDLQGEAEKCLQDLIDRCLVLVCKKSLDETKIRSCKVHDLVYEFCLREVQNEIFFSLRQLVPGNPDYIYSDHYRILFVPRLITQQTDGDNENSCNLIRSIFSLYSTYSTFILEPDIVHCNFLKILDLSPITLDVFPPLILCLSFLRYLVLSTHGGRFDIPPEICRLWSLRTFIVEGYRPTYIHFPEQIWELWQLRHLGVYQFDLLNPPSISVDEERCSEFSNIHTVSGLCVSSCTKEVISGIQNVKKLGIYADEYEFKTFHGSRLFDNLANLHQLETLSLKVSVPLQTKINKVPMTIPSAKAFPTTLKKLKLDNTCLRWEDMDIIGELPDLEVLKLMLNACCGQEWHPIAGGFTRLKLLLIKHNYHLKYWKATNDNFPVLERLVITYCTELEEMPIEFADMDSLQLIELSYCTAQLEASAARIQQEQEDLGNKPVDVRISDTYNPCW
ncbi:PREDICTED: putative late blight resistance protein homolog R1B-16 [Nicotiana attenuata]|uniref:Late blight resistance protein -like r1b-16 n=1 Tax=Nicotiana attenuata TaxID=49451 RepID=A0A1J6I9C0_NICAT|nr:PREDICTED: putative late blight resistance protein homolog R1B-16 [Nicotiana attenuata]XP_019246796.1 PREDICTED: putative late blight resistance protein homolog R1B-16 [Nicotiana attenuata]XP_019246798.1 PREDICTED: putative late blight resistance protein homolog R1B-16 [Nicotiana attenuata]OIT01574.1 putative late blight resistance protein -like r1b-16 [Nicotiana attenuata]